MNKIDDFNEEDQYENEEDYAFYPESDEEPCPFIDLVCSMLGINKPFGFMWEEEKMIEFLKERGYKILERKTNDGTKYKVAGKSYIPEEEVSNIANVFSSEIQDIILKWLLKIAKEI